MENNIPCTIHELEMIDGTKVPLTLTFDALYRLKGLRSDIIDDYDKIMSSGAKSELQIVRVIYVAYLCGMIKVNGGIDEALDYVDFLALIPSDREYVGGILIKLVAPKKTMASVSLS